MLSLAEVLQWPSLCKDVRKELQYAVKHELITEKEANYIMRRCGKYEERRGIGMMMIIKIIIYSISL